MRKPGHQRGVAVILAIPDVHAGTLIRYRA
jgi:hypothetical protein